MRSNGSSAVLRFWQALLLVGVFVVRYLLDFISRNGFAPFAYWRIFVGAVGLWGVLLFG